MNISSPKNGEGSQKSGRSRKKQKSGNESNIIASFSTRNRQGHLTVNKILKLNRKVINHEPTRKPSTNDAQLENGNMSKSLENVGGSSGFIHLNNIHTSEIVHAVQRFSEQPVSMKRAVQLLNSDVCKERAMTQTEEITVTDMMGGNFNTFGDHAQNMFTHNSDD